MVVSDVDEETETACAGIIEEVQAKESDEEWLEDNFQSTQDESYEVPVPLKKIKIKREVRSPLVQRSRRQSIVYAQDIGSNTLFIPDDPPSVQDEYSVFGEYIAKKMRKFKSPRTRGNLQQAITTMLWQAEYGMYDSSDAVKRILMLPVAKEQSEKRVTSVTQDELEVPGNSDQTEISL